jgi:uncharacterized coiled-coil protein SlyX
MNDIFLGLLAGLAGYLLNHFIDSFKKKDEELKVSDEEQDKLVQTLARDLVEHSKQMIRLEGKIDLLMANINPLQRLPKDVQELFVKVRALEVQRKG